MLVVAVGIAVAAPSLPVPAFAAALQHTNLTQSASEGSAARLVYQTRHGPVAPEQLPSGVFAFRSIPFAAPPVSALRWRSPQPPAPWTAPLDTAPFPPMCVQSGNMQLGSEDCLYLYVYTTSAPADAAADRKPVLLWVHGGGLQTGDGYLGSRAPPWLGGVYDGSRLAEEFGVVVVSVQYRLGALGFLASPEFMGEDGGVGNYGVQDQRAGMQWVRDNIANFGGE